MAYMEAMPSRMLVKTFLLLFIVERAILLSSLSFNGVTHFETVFGKVHKCI